MKCRLRVESKISYWADLTGGIIADVEGDGKGVVGGGSIVGKRKAIPISVGTALRFALSVSGEEPTLLAIYVCNRTAAQTIVQ